MRPRAIALAAGIGSGAPAMEPDAVLDAMDRIAAPLAGAPSIARQAR